MLKTIKKYLKEPYPYYYGNYKRFFWVLLFISMLSFCFSYFFEPFVVNVAEHKIKTTYILLIHAFIPLPIAFCYFLGINIKVKEDTYWTIGKEIFHLSVLLILIGITDFLIRDFIYNNPNNWSFRYLSEEIRNTFLIGFLLLIIVLPINLERLIYKHSNSLKQITKTNTAKISKVSILINTPMENEKFELPIKEFHFAKVESNYTEIYYAIENKIQKKIIRITLKDLEDQLQQVSNFIFKTHRSYLVNLKSISSISGNAQGYQLHLNNYEKKIPVSRNRIKAFNLAYHKA